MGERVVSNRLVSDFLDSFPQLAQGFMGIDAVRHVTLRVPEYHLPCVVIDVGVIKPRGAGVAGVMELMLFAVYQFHLFS